MRVAAIGEHMLALPLSTTRLPPPTTTTTLGWPAGCLYQALSGFDAVFRRLDTLAETLSEEDAIDVGGQVTYARLQRRLGRAHDVVAVAQAGRRVRRHCGRRCSSSGRSTGWCAGRASRGTPIPI
jgi:hypothetical protein